MTVILTARRGPPPITRTRCPLFRCGPNQPTAPTEEPDVPDLVEHEHDESQPGRDAIVLRGVGSRALPVTW